MQTPLIFHPTTPPSNRIANFFQASSPLTPTTPQKPLTPVTETQARRRSQYKSRPTTSPVTPHGRHSEPRSRRPKGLTPLNFGQPSDSAASAGETPRTAVLRERLKARCIERARQDREEKLKRKRALLSSEPSSEGFDETMDYEDEDDEDEDAVFNDEVSSVIYTRPQCMLTFSGILALQADHVQYESQKTAPISPFIRLRCGLFL